MATKSKKRPKPRRPGRFPKKPPSCLGEESTRLFERIAEEAVHADRVLFEGLSSHERKIVLQWLSEALIEDDTRNIVHDTLWEIDYRRKPVDIDTFIKDDTYFGLICKDLHPLWVRDLQAVFEPGSKIFEWILTGAIGIGKTTLAMTAMGYRLHCMSCLRDPASYYGLLPESLIIFGIYSITKRQVADTGYFKLRGWIDTSPYFRREFPRSMKIDSKIDFKPAGQNLQVIPGSQELHALGLDLFSFSMDEVNFMREKRDKDRGIIAGQAYDLYNATHSRIMSRFLRPGGTIPGIMLLMSSRNAQTSFLEERLKKVRNSPYTYVSDYALWEVKPKAKFKLPPFRVQVGDRVSQSRILANKEKPRPGARIIEGIPGDFLQVFEEDIDQNLRDIAGVATFNISPLVRDRQSVFDAVRESMVHPFTKPEAMIDYKDDVMLDEFFIVSTSCRIRESNWTPRLNPNAQRFMHIDLSLSGDCAALAMGHVSGLIRKEKMRPDGTKSVSEYPFIIIDFMLRINPPPASEIDLEKIRAFVFYISKLYPLTMITFDGFQSADCKQLLRKAGYDARLQSIDKNDKPYLSLRAAHFDRRIAMYHYEPYIREVLDLERNAKKEKVDHPTRSTHGGKGTKDVSDSVAGVVFACTNDVRALSGATLVEDISEIEDKIVRQIIDPDSDVDLDEQSKRAVREIGGTRVDMAKLSMDD